MRRALADWSIGPIRDRLCANAHWLLADAIANSILTNANLKVFMRGNDPDSAEYFSKVIGTVKAIKRTERMKRSFLRSEATGDTSAREVDEFIVHPNRFKRELGVDQAVMIVPHEAGSRVVNIKFRKFDDQPALNIAAVPKTCVEGLKTADAERQRDSKGAKPGNKSA